MWRPFAKLVIYRVGRTVSEAPLILLLLLLLLLRMCVCEGQTGGSMDGRQQSRTRPSVGRAAYINSITTKSTMSLHCSDDTADTNNTNIGY